MVVDYFDVVGVLFFPAKADAPLVVDADAVLPCSVAFEGLQAIAGRYPQILQAARDFKLANLAPCDRSDIRESTAIEAV